MIDLYGYEDEDRIPNKKLLESWGPSYWKQFREMEANYAFAGWTLDLMEYQIYRLINNLFILTSDEKTIEKYEKLFGITATSDNTLTERKNALIPRYIGHQKISFSSIKAMIRKMTGAEVFMSWVNGNASYAGLFISLWFDETQPVSFPYLHQTIAAKLPAHIKLLNFDVDIKVHIPTQFPMLSDRAITVSTCTSLYDDKMLNGKYSLDGKITMDQERGMQLSITVKRGSEDPVEYSI